MRNDDAMASRPLSIQYIDPTDQGLDLGDEIIVCGICKQILNRFSQDDGEIWIHPRPWERFDHDPAPRVVPRSSVTFSDCDFCCLQTELHWCYVGERLRARVKSGAQDFGSHWRACKSCSVLIQAGDLGGLLDRVADLSPILQADRDPATHRQLRMSMMNVWTMLFPTVHTTFYIGPQRQPARLTAQMVAKLQRGLLKFWRHPELRERMIDDRVKNNQILYIPGVHSGDEDQFVVHFPPESPLPESVWTNHIQHLRTGIEASEDGGLYWIASNFTQLSIVAGKDFDKLVLRREALPTEYGFMVYEEPIAEVARPAGAARIRGVSWTLVPQGVWLNLYFQGEDGDPDVDVAEMRQEFGYLICPNPGVGIPFNEEFANPEDPGFDFLGTVLATWFLMNQPGVAEQTVALVDRKYSRSFQREFHRRPPEVNLVDLRRQPRRAKGPGGHVGRPLTERVLRRGHWKEQPYGPKRALRKPIYINQYIAGPQGAPLKLPTPTVKVLR